MRMGLGKMLLCSCMAAFVFLTGMCFAAETAESDEGGNLGTQEEIVYFEKKETVRGIKNAGFSDLGAGHWVYEEVSILADHGIVDGYPDGSFRPAQQVTYGEFIKMICAAVDARGVSAGAGTDTGVNVKEEIDTGDESNVGLKTEEGMFLEDMKSGHWARKYYDTALENGFLKRNVIEAGMLDMKIPRKHMAHVAAGVLDVLAAKESNSCENESVNAEEKNVKRGNVAKTVMSYSEAAKMLSDVSAASEHGDDIITSVAAGVLTGYPDGEFKANATLTRAEAAAVAGRIMRIVQASGTLQEEEESKSNEDGQADGTGELENTAGENAGKADTEKGTEGATGEVIVRKVQKGKTAVNVEYSVYEKSAVELGIAKIEQESERTIKIYAERKYPFIKIMLEDGTVLKSVGFPGGSFYEEDGYFVYVADPEGRDLNDRITKGGLYLVIDDEGKKVYRVLNM